MNDLNFAGQIASLRLYADDTTTYRSHHDITFLEISLNHDIDILLSWLSRNYLMVNNMKSQAMMIGDIAYNPQFIIGDSRVELSNSLKILGVIIDDKLTFADHIQSVIKKVYAKIGALRRLKKLMPVDVSLSLYKAYILPHLEYCSPLLLGINKTLSSKLESVNKYALKTLLNLGNSVDYNTILAKSNMTTLEHRRFYSSLVLLFKCMKWNGPEYIKNFFQLRESRYNLRNKGVNLVQPGYNNRFYHNSFTYKVGHLWNSLPRELKTASKLSDFCCKLKTFDFSTLGPICKCNTCI